MKVLHGLTGSVATVLNDKIRQSYNLVSFDTKFIATNNSFQISSVGEAYTDSSEWFVYREEKKVLHIELVKWADVFVIAPLSANTLAKIANGICDNLLTCVARAWDFEKPFIVAPAMNCNMMSHPIYKEHIDKIKSWGIKVVEPQSKKLFCGDYGSGAMAQISDIIEEILSKNK